MRMKAIAAGLLLMTGVAHADLTGTVTAVSDYDFRGVSISGTDPALQGSIDWAHDSGFYAGIWGSSSIDFGPGTDANFEADGYFGYSGSTGENGFRYTAGFVYYSYWPDGDDVDYWEVSVGGGMGPVDAKLWYTSDYSNLGLDAYYLEANLNYPLPKNFSLLAHMGYNFGDYWSIDGATDEHIDWSVGAGLALGHFNMVLKWVDNETDFVNKADAFNNEGRLIFTVSTTFPWANE